MKSLNRKSVVLCDDHPIINEALESILQRNDFEVIKKFNDATSLTDFYKDNRSDILICDLNIDHSDTFQVLSKIKSIHPAIRTIIFSAYGEPVFIKKAKQAGVNAYVLKDSSYEEILRVIQMEQEGFYKTVSSQLPASNDHLSVSSEMTKFRLSEREKNIISLILKGKTSEQIGQQLFISKLTVDTHRKNIHKKIGVSGLLNLQEFAKKFGIE